MKTTKPTRATKPTSKTKSTAKTKPMTSAGLRMLSETHFAKARLFSAKADLADAKNPPKPSKGLKPY